MASSETERVLPVAFEVVLVDGFDPTDTSTLAKRSLCIRPIPHPDLVRVIEAMGATREGQMTFRFGLKEGVDGAPLWAAVDRCVEGLVVPQTLVVAASGSATKPFGRYTGVRALAAAGNVRMHPKRSYWERWIVPTEPEKSFGVLAVNSSPTNAYLKFSTTPHADEILADTWVPKEWHTQLNIHQLGRNPKDPRPIHPVEALSIAEELERLGVTVVYGPGVSALRQLAATSVAVYPTPGRPAEPCLVAGRKTPIYSMLTKWVPTGTMSADTVDSTELYGLLTNFPDERWFVDPQISDIAAMAAAEPIDDDRLYPFQRVAVAVHLATRFGYALFSEPGTGKTVCALTAMRLRSQGRPDYRGLVVCEANVRAQWAGEAATWFPQAEVFVVSSGADAGELADTLASATKPVVVIVSYDLVRGADGEIPAARQERFDPFANSAQGSLFDLSALDGAAPVAEDRDLTVAEVLMQYRWADIVADEAACLRNPSTRQSRALWALREQAEIAVPLTGTPITRTGVDDLCQLIAWARNDSSLFVGHKLSKTFDISKDEDLEGLSRALGPLMFRRNKSEISSKLPKLTAKVVRLRPTAAELELSEAARHQLRLHYEELVEMMRLVDAKEGSVSPEELEEVKEALKAARGAWLGGTQLARMASSDPEAVAASTSAAAELLRGSGLIDAAVENGGTKRAWTVDYCANLAAKGEQALVFTEFASVVESLSDALTQAGLRVGKVVGGGGKARDRDIARFRSGELDVLVCSAAGKRGLNLQTASAVIHYDLPWTPDDVAQRTARVERIGASAEQVEVVYPILEGTIEERIVALLAARSAEAVRALDVSRGADASGTDMGRILASLADSVDTSELEGRQLSMLEMTRALVAP